MSQEVVEQQNAVQRRCSSVPAPTFDGLDPEISQALTRSYNTNLLVNQTLTQQFFCDGMREVANQMGKFQEFMMKSTAEAMASTTRQITTTLRQEMSAAQQVMESHISDLKQEMKDHFSSRQMETYIHKRALRSCVAWMLRLGPDTVRAYGMTPIFRFVQHDAQHLTVFDLTSFATWSYLHRKKFTPNMTRAFVKNVGREVEEFVYHAPSTAQLREWQALFPFQFSGRSKLQEALMVIKTEQVVKFLAWERALERDGKAVLSSRDQGVFETHLRRSRTRGRMRCQGFGDNPWTFGSPNLTKSQANTCLGAKAVKNLWSYDDVRAKTRDYFTGNKNNHDAWMARRVYFGLADSSEYLSSPVFYQGVSMIREKVFELSTPGYDPANPFHLVQWDDSEVCDETVNPLWQLLPNQNCVLRQQLEPRAPSPLLDDHVHTSSDEDSDAPPPTPGRPSKRRSKRRSKKRSQQDEEESPAKRARPGVLKQRIVGKIVVSKSRPSCVTNFRGVENTERKEVGGKCPRKTVAMLSELKDKPCDISAPATPKSGVSPMDVAVPDDIAVPDNIAVPDDLNSLSNEGFDLDLPQAMAPSVANITEEEMANAFPVGSQNSDLAPTQDDTQLNF